MEKCPECGKELKNKASLRSHKAKYHKALDDDDRIDDDADQDDSDVLDIDDADDDADDAEYFCQNCKADVQKGTATCPSCGLQLDWTGLD